MSIFKKYKIEFERGLFKDHSSSSTFLLPDNINKLYNRIVKYFFEEFFNISKAIETEPNTNISLQNIYGEFGDDLNSYYPELANKFMRFMTNQQIWIIEIQNVIQKAFKRKKILDIILFKGDLHNSNRSTSLVILQDGSRVYVKPKSFFSEQNFYSILSHNFPLLPISQQPFRYASFEGIEIMEDIEKRNNKVDDIKFYYYQLGIAASLFWLLSTSDIFDENILLLGNESRPAFIDAKSDYRD